jgi:hypothetical protein
MGCVLGPLPTRVKGGFIMERRKVRVSTDNCWDLVTIFAFASPYTLDGGKLTTLVHDEVVGWRYRQTIKITKNRDRYRVSFAHAEEDNVEEKIKEIMGVLEKVEGKIERALELDAMKSLLEDK